MFQYETIVDLHDLKYVSFVCRECKTVTTFHVEAAPSSKELHCGRCYTPFAVDKDFISNFRKLREIAKSFGILLRTEVLKQKPVPEPPKGE